MPLEVKFLLGFLSHCYHFQLFSITGEGQGIKYLLVPQGMNWIVFCKIKRWPDIKGVKLKLMRLKGKVPRQPFQKYRMVIL